jgi:nicotinate-nucleotide adenylyltransferase
MNIGFFGGTFDPIHRGHMALARAAREHYKLSRILFVPANVPPHKQSQPLSAWPPRRKRIFCLLCSRRPKRMSRVV